MSYTNLQALQSAISNEMFGSLPSFTTPILPFPSPGNWTIPKSFNTIQNSLSQVPKNPALTGKATTSSNAGLVGFDNRLSSSTGNLWQSLKGEIGNFNSSSIGGIASSIATGLRGLTEQDVSYTGKAAEIANGVGDVAENINGMINPLGNTANQVGATIGNLIGGTEDRVKGVGSAVVDGISAVASNLGPIGMAVGTALQLVNGIGGKRVDKLQDNTTEIASRTGSAYSGSIGDVQENIDKYSNKKAGLFDFGFAKEGNSAIDKAEKIQNTMLDIGRYQDLRKSNNAAADLAQQNRNRYSGYTGAVPIGQEGMKLDLPWAKGLLSKFQKGGKTESKTRTLEELKAYADSVNPRFVQRMNDPNITGINFIDDKGNAAFETHYMTYGYDDDGNYYVYPRIQEINGMLQFLDDDTAWHTAVKNKNLLKMNNKDEAINFAENYKKVYPVFQKFRKGGKLGTPGIESNVIVEGAYHAHKNHLDEVNPELSDMTPKGIPVATEDASGNKTQVAEIEVGELILTKDLTDKLEELYKDGSDDAAIQAGMLFANEIIDNTVDNKGGVLDGE